MADSIHIAVMTREAMDALRPTSGGKYLDATLGGGTHSNELLERSAPKGKVLSLDVDPVALDRAAMRFKPFGKRWKGVEGNFRHLDEIVQREKFAPLDGILIDLGLSSDELDDPSKGLSFRTDGPLDMRLGPKANEDGLTASDIVNSWNETELTKLIQEFGEERYAWKIATAIIAARKHHRFDTTLELAEAIKAAVPANYERGRIHPATRTFQALRIAVNDELQALKEAIEASRRVLAPNGVLAIISFHSLEDRIVKNAFKDADDLEVLTKKPLVPQEDELEKNPRARSAKFRAARKSLS
ncbi:MAG: 16S rRNA (cytosine(1402)-N(4))-methyltransferase RsmH [Patescibacteria group bacterium]